MVTNGKVIVMTSAAGDKAWRSMDGGETWDGPYATGAKRGTLGEVKGEFWLTGTPARASADGQTWRDLPATVPSGKITVSDKGTLISTDTAGSLLTTINQLSPIWVRFSLAESDLAKIPGGRVGRDTPIDVQVKFADGTAYPDKGRLNFAATAIDTRLGTQQLRAEFDNAREQLLPGQFVTVVLGAGERANVFLVPQTAVVQTEKSSLVFVVDADGKAQARSVQTGDWVGSDWAITSGLAAGDSVIVDNLLKVRPGAPVTATPAAASGAPAASPAPASTPAAPK